MGIFDLERPAPEPEPPSPPAPRWLKPDDVLPGVVPLELVLAHTDRVAIAISALEVYPTGFAFRVSVVLRERQRRFGIMAHPMMVHGLPDKEDLPPEFLRLGVRFPDGGRATNLSRRANFKEDQAGPILLPGSSSGGDRRWDASFWVWPSPTPGTLTFVCAWPAFDVPETSVDVDTADLRTAADRAVTLWPA